MRRYKPNRSFKTLEDICGSDAYGICPAPMDDKMALRILTDYLLGEDYYIVMPVSHEQANTVIVTDILDKYSKQFKKDIKRRKK